MDVKGKLVIITGSGMGLGKAFASKLLEAGAMVCISDLDEAIGLKTTTEFSEKFGKDKLHFIKCNVLQKDDIVNLYESCERHFGKTVDIFCNNAGINHNRGWRLCMDIDIMAVMECTEYVMEKMNKENGGKGGLIVNTASLAGIAVGLDKESACYFVAKHGVVALTRTLGRSKTLKTTGVKVQCICPAFADTNILADIGDNAMKAVKTRFGLMTPEFVADGFMKLVTRCNNGEAMVIVKDVPPFIYGDWSKEWTLCLATGSKIFNAIFGVDLFTPQLQIVYFFIIFLIVHFFVNFMTSFIF